MIIHTIIDPLDIFYEEPKQPEAQNSESFSTDPYFFFRKTSITKIIFKRRNELFIACKKSYVRQYGPPLP